MADGYSVNLDPALGAGAYLTQPRKTPNRSKTLGAEASGVSTIDRKPVPAVSPEKAEAQSKAVVGKVNNFSRDKVKAKEYRPKPVDGALVNLRKRIEASLKKREVSTANH